MYSDEVIHSKTWHGSYVQLFIKKVEKILRAYGNLCLFLVVYIVVKNGFKTFFHGDLWRNPILCGFTVLLSSILGKIGSIICWGNFWLIFGRFWKVPLMFSMKNQARKKSILAQICCFLPKISLKNIYLEETCAGFDFPAIFLQLYPLFVGTVLI